MRKFIFVSPPPINMPRQRVLLVTVTVGRLRLVDTQVIEKKTEIWVQSGFIMMFIIIKSID